MASPPHSLQVTGIVRELPSMLGRVLGAWAPAVDSCVYVVVLLPPLWPERELLLPTTDSLATQ